ncbi:CapA family protein [Methylohalobius crimeensis]|uniref:CapA family protein n=1 Tax=Methylohalobius crimeensis TaxID=244365 RepID=UPI000688E40A|nr:CapA family protein [Methylohalobius crimeensis]
MKPSSRPITLFLCGDVMTGRGIDQILPHPAKPHLYESYMRSALGYVKIAEQANGPIQRPVDFSYIWGDALDAFRRVGPDLRIVNLETAVTASEDAWPGKGIHYRMHPANLPCLTAAGIDCCVLANNHVLDWGRSGLMETLSTLHRAGIRTAGAGRDAAEAAKPAVLEVPGKGRVLVFAWGMADSGVPYQWVAEETLPGVNFLPDLGEDSAETVTRQVRPAKRTGDLVIASIHWGGNWGFSVSPDQREFAHRLIDAAGVDLVHGHSSHHVKGIEVYRGKPILYGCGDFLNDYEGIGGYEAFRGDLALMYFPTLENNRLSRFLLTPTQTRRFRANYAPEAGVAWLKATLNREGKRFGTRVTPSGEHDLRLHGYGTNRSNRRCT